MPESAAHKAAKKRAAGATGSTEVETKGGRLDAATRTKAVEVERSGDPRRLRHAATKLKNSGKASKVLVVPQKNLAKGRDALRRSGVSGTVKNMSGTQASYVGVTRTSPKVGRSPSGRNGRRR